MQQIGGIQLNTKPGTDFDTQYMVPDTGLTNKTTQKDNPLYNLAQVLFKNTQTNNISEQIAKCDVVGTNGLKNNTEKGEHKLFTQA